ncbi:MAG TPA: chromosome segregation protein SMC [Nanoarchaeota archaeon]|nr:chromosome segregation protein SMC [Nanoarchaeota archaeon]HIH63262.1 chromosome segregation protein SMC [Nanoarchaeota archaeon]HIJ09258.1 chromosome segregation protein SMC [Nanoarchaeota archaeon]
MAYIKKLVMYGFKSFVRKTEIPFTPGINCVLGPNGSGKSNVSDGLCFVLGRLSAKSMRAAKASNLIFMGTKDVAPAKEASVEIVFDNTDNTFSLIEKEISIRRILRKNGQSIYKINNKIKTRQEVLGLLAQGGIDPNGFNIILQGEIQNFVRMHTEERRKVIEEVAGISIYELRKESSLKELDKTDEKLKEILAILKERTSYLNNLDKERQQALKFKKLEQDIQKYKASIIYSDLTKRKSEIQKINSEISEKNKEIEQIKKIILTIETSVKSFESKIETINLTIQKSTGLEQERLNQDIANLRAELAGMIVKSENLERKLSEISKQKQELNESIRNNEISIKELKKESPTIIKKEKEIQAKKLELEKLEEKRKKFYMIKSELRSIIGRFEDKNSFLKSYINESDFLLRQIESISKDILDKKITPEKIESFKLSVAEKKSLLESLGKRESELEKVTYTNEYEIDKQEKLIENISKIDICPVCKSKVTKEHIHSIHEETIPRVSKLRKEIDESDKELSDIANKKELLKKEIEDFQIKISQGESDLMRISGINEKKDQIKNLQEKIEEAKKELLELDKKKKNLDQLFQEDSNIEQKYETARIEIQEISLRSEENVNSEISFKQREFERAKISLKQLTRDEEDLGDELKLIKKNIEIKEELLEKNKIKDKELSQKFEKLIEERDSYQKKIRENEMNQSTHKNKIYNIDQEINNIKINKARVDAEIENFENEMLGFDNVEILKINRDSLLEKLNHAKEIISNIGSVNLRSLEVYDEIKKEYDAIKEKVEIIEKEKEEIMKVIHEVDIRKKKTFIKTLDELNEIFSRNFSQLSAKGQVSLELENKKDPFEGGVNIMVKMGQGKYFDVKSLSGGEQTLIALSLIFGIQELKPYCFYILDEIDAALDKRNSERLADLLKRYMKHGQYIVITHNDEIISNATNLYGVSMHDGISKIISLKV